MANVTQDSSNLLAEKLALTRELAVLKPELEHLRSQVNHQQETLSEKLSLERQVNTLEAELANEKKAAKRALQKRESTDRAEDELRKKLRETEKKLTAEKTERERLEDQLEQEKQAHQFALQGQDSTRELEADLRKKLQDAQKQLREEQKDKERLEEELQEMTRASQKAQKKQASKEVENELRALLEEAQADLETQKKETEKVQQENQTAMSEVETQNEQLEKKVEKFKVKVREVQEQLKQCQSDLRKAQQARISTTEETQTKMVAGPQGFRKRKAHDMSADDFTHITIETPSAEEATRGRRAAVKKRAVEPTVVGEKSTFSITPFLNRNKAGSEDTPEHNDDEMINDSILGTQHSAKTLELPGIAPEEDPAEATDSESAAPAVEEDDKPKFKRGRPKKAPLDAPSARKNAQPAMKKTVKISKPSLKKASKEAPEADSNQESQPKAKEAGAEPAPEKTATVKFNLALSQEEESKTASGHGRAEPPKKKKRKVLGSTKTLFDEDDGEAPAPAVVPVRKTGKVQLGGARALSKAPLGVKRAAFASAASTFSPLKRERRGVGASFLA